jgi:tight adherence protein B
VSRKPDAAADQEEVAALVQRLAVLLAAGVAPPSAWGYLLPDDDQPKSSLVANIVDQIKRHVAADDAILAVVNSAPEASGWRGLAAAWGVASAAGAPLAPTLAELAASLRDLAERAGRCRWRSLHPSPRRGW